MASRGRKPAVAAANEGPVTPTGPQQMRGRKAERPTGDRPRSGRSASRSPSPGGVTKARTMLLIEQAREGFNPIRALKHGACTDSWHDFHVKKGYNTTGVLSTNSYGLYDTKVGIPGGAESEIPLDRDEVSDPNSLHTENEILQEIFHNLEIGGVKISDNTHPKYYTDTLVRALAENVENNKNHTTPSFVCDSVIATEAYDDMEKEDYSYEKNTYHIKILHKKYDADEEGIWAQTNTAALVGRHRLSTEELYNFFGSDNVNLLFDASVIDVIGLLRNCKDKAGAAARAFTVNRLINREIVNDPATKPYEFKKKPRVGASANISAYNLFDDNTEPIIYSKFLSGQRELNRHLFFSNFDFSLGKLIYAGGKKAGLPKMDLDIKENILGGGVVNYFDSNPHEGNNINKCWTRICSLDEKSKTKHIDAAVNFQCKRSGDWLQALSCFDTGRKYVKFTGEKKMTQPEQVALVGDKIILVTHDRVLLYYALLLGLDVIMTYKIKPEGSNAKDEGEGEDDEEEEEEEDAAVDNDFDIEANLNRSTKHLIYFCNQKRLSAKALTSLKVKEPAVSAKDRITEKISIFQTKSVDEMNAFIGEYNSNIDSIIYENETKIETLVEGFNAELKKEKRKQNPKNLSNSVTSIIQSYIKLSCGVYKYIDGDEIVTAFNEADTASKTNLSTATEPQLIDIENKIMKYISIYDNIKAKSSLYGSKQDIIEKHNAYKLNVHYKNLINLPSLVREESRSLRGSIDSSPEKLLLELATYFVKSLTPKHLYNLAFDLKQITGGLGSGAIRLVDKFFKSIKAFCPQSIYDNIDEEGSTRKPANASKLTEVNAEKTTLVAEIEESITTLQEEQSKLESMPSKTAKDKKAVSGQQALVEAINDGVDQLEDKLQLLNGQPTSFELSKGEVMEVIPDVINALKEEQEIAANVDLRVDIFEEICATKEWTWSEENITDNSEAEKLEERKVLSQDKSESLFELIQSAMYDEYITDKKTELFNEKKAEILKGKKRALTSTEKGNIRDEIEDDILEEDVQVGAAEAGESLVSEMKENIETYIMGDTLDNNDILDGEEIDIIVNEGASWLPEDYEENESEENEDLVWDSMPWSSAIKAALDIADEWAIIADIQINLHKPLIEIIDSVKSSIYFYNWAKSTGIEKRKLSIKAFDIILDRKQQIYEKGDRVIESFKIEKDEELLELLLEFSEQEQDDEKQINQDSLKPIVEILPGRLDAIDKDDVDLIEVLAEAANAENDEEAIDKETHIWTTLGDTLQMCGSTLIEAAHDYDKERLKSLQDAVKTKKEKNAIKKSFEPALNEGLVQRVEEAQSGGGIDKSSQVAHALVLFYLRQLITDLSGFDSGDNEDYKYYQTLSYLVLSTCQKAPDSLLKHHKNPEFYNNLQAVFFDKIPNGDITVDGKPIISNASYKSSVALVGKQVALQTCGLRTGHINSLGNVGEFPLETVEIYNAVKVEVKALSFSNRLKTLIAKLRQTLYSYIDSPPYKQALPSNNIPLSIKLNTNMKALTEARMARINKTRKNANAKAANAANAANAKTQYVNGQKLGKGERSALTNLHNLRKNRTAKSEANKQAELLSLFELMKKYNSVEGEINYNEVPVLEEPVEIKRPNYVSNFLRTRKKRNNEKAAVADVSNNIEVVSENKIHKLGTGEVPNNSRNRVKAYLNAKKRREAKEALAPDVIASVQEGQILGTGEVPNNARNRVKAMFNAKEKRIANPVQPLPKSVSRPYVPLSERTVTLANIERMTQRNKENGVQSYGRAIKVRGGKTRKTGRKAGRKTRKSKRKD